MRFANIPPDSASHGEPEPHLPSIASIRGIGFVVFTGNPHHLNPGVVGNAREQDVDDEWSLDKEAWKRQRWSVAAAWIKDSIL